MISIIMPSYLGEYKKAAKDRDKKIVRAIQSVFNQTYEDWELIIIADGCEKTVDIILGINDIYNDERLKVFKIEKQRIWSGSVRNAGLEEAKGEYACYLDNDDAFAPNHLESLVKGMAAIPGKDWYWFDDYGWNRKEFRHTKRNINKVGQCGTSNIMHRPGLAQWDEKGNYAHDWQFIKNLKRASSSYEYLRAGEYLICHVPGKFDI